MEYKVFSNRIKIIDSYTICSDDMDACLNIIKSEQPNHCINNRDNTSLSDEWATHNLCYKLHIARSKTKDVDLEHPQKWYLSMVYGLIGSFAKSFNIV